MATISSKTQKALDAQAERTRQRLERERVQEERKRAADNAEIDRLIKETGWAVCVSDTDDPGDPAPHFGYTIGRSLKNQPELCAWGHVREEIAPLLNVVGALLEMDETIKIPEPGEVLTLPGVGAWMIHRVPPEVFAHLHYARARYTYLRAVRLRRIA